MGPVLGYAKGVDAALAAALLLLSPAVAQASQGPEACLRQHLEARRTAAGIGLRAEKRLDQAYRRREFRLLWNRPAVEALQAEVQRYGLEGIRLPLDHERGLRALEAAQAPCDLADRDLLASDLYVVLATRLGQGHIHPRRIDPSWRPPRRRTRIDGLLLAAPSARALRTRLEQLRPSSPQYDRLAAALARMRTLEAGWSSPPPSDDSGSPQGSGLGDWLRHRLSFEPEGAALTPTANEGELATVLMGVQRRHGVPPSGRLDRATLDVLKQPLSERIAQIEANLERLRWLDESDDGAPHRTVRIDVELAARELRLIRRGREDLVLPVAFGRETLRTPVLRAELPYLVLNPTWFVPPRVARQDLLPKILQDPNYLPDHHLRTYLRGATGWERVKGVEQDWLQIVERHIPFRLIQAPGPKNYLGKVKFVLPDANGIYVHGGPPHRPFEPGPASAGCIRVQDPLSLARAVVEGDPVWSIERLDRASASGREITVHLARPIPVRILYRTAWVDRQGRLQLRDDVYGRDRIVIQAIDRFRS